MAFCRRMLWVVVAILVAPLLTATAAEGDGDGYYAVISIPNIEDSYLEALRVAPVFDPFHRSHIRSKMLYVCTEIIQSPYIFDNYNVHAAINSQNYDRKSTKERTPGRENNETSLDFEEREISLRDQNFHDFVFPCPARNFKSETTITFFISRMHDLNGEFRFILQRNDEQKLVPILVAERPAYVWTGEKATIERRNAELLLRSPNVAAKTPQICELTATDRANLCTIILSSPIYSKVIRYPAHGDKSEPKCEQRELIFRTGIRDDKSEEGAFQAWTLECKTTKRSRLSSMLSKSYFISMSPQQDEFYLAETVDNKTRIIGRCWTGPTKLS